MPDQERSNERKVDNIPLAHYFKPREKTLKHNLHVFEFLHAYRSKHRSPSQKDYSSLLPALFQRLEQKTTYDTASLIASFLDESFDSSLFKAFAHTMLPKKKKQTTDAQGWTLQSALTPRYFIRLWGIHTDVRKIIYQHSDQVQWLQQSGIASLADLANLHQCRQGTADTSLLDLLFSFNTAELEQIFTNQCITFNDLVKLNNTVRPEQLPDHCEKLKELLQNRLGKTTLGTHETHFVHMERPPTISLYAYVIDNNEENINAILEENSPRSCCND
jgi:hypothetical protein